MATYYVDAAMADDTGAGTSQATAKRTPRAAQLAAASGDKILIKTGYCYSSVSGQFMFFSGISNVEVGTYGTLSDKPILDALTYQNPGATGWTHVSSGIWKKTFGGFYIRRLWVASQNNGILTTQRTLGTAKRRAWGTGLAEVTGSPASANPSESTILANLNSNMIWFGAGSTLSYALYVYTGSTITDPPTYYDGIAFIQSDGSTVGGVAGVHVQNQTGIYVHDIHFRGNGGTGIRLQAQNSDTRDAADCLFQNCLVSAPYQGAFRSLIVGEASPARRIRNIVVDSVTCDYFGGSDETEYAAAYSNLSGISDNFCIADGSVNVTVQNCTSINAAHQGIVAGSLAMRTTPPSACAFINNTIRFDSWHAYGRGLSNYDGDTLFLGNMIDGQNTRSQLAGSARVIGNIWKNLGDSVRKPGVAEWIACESYMQDMFTSGIGNERYLRVQPVNVQVFNNTVYGPLDYAVSFNYYDKTAVGDGDNSFNAGTITIQNNIIDSPQSNFLHTYADSTLESLYGKVIGQQTVSSNVVYDGRTANAKISWRGTDYSINAAPGCTGNLEICPRLDSSHRPQHPSLKRAGLTVVGKDFNGKQLYNPPNIGAVDDETLTPRYGLRA